MTSVPTLSKDFQFTMVMGSGDKTWARQHQRYIFKIFLQSLFILRERERDRA